jgi:3-hydroxyisobutyrate dehydrogenase-like beta-hydroxyacid dehydrogenase
VPRDKITRIAFIGFGEVGQRFAAGLLRASGVEIAAYDLIFDDPVHGRERMAIAEAMGVALAHNSAEACREAAIVISAVTADAVEAAALDAGRHLSPAQTFFDVNSAAPSTKRRAASHVEAAGARYVEGAIMAAVPSPGIRVPILAGGPSADDLAALLNTLGMNITPVGAEYGMASTIKLCRSIIIKGLEALIADCTSAARQAGVEHEVFASLAETFPSIDWPRLAETMAERVARHGRRRAAEMHEAADMLAEMGIDADLARAVAEAQARGAGQS